LKEHNELRYHRLTNVLTSLAKVTFEDTFLVKEWIQTRMSETIAVSNSRPMSDSDNPGRFSSEVRVRCSYPFKKAHFLKHPGQVLLSIYFFCVFGLGYSVFVCERASPTVQPIELEVIYFSNDR